MPNIIFKCPHCGRELAVTAAVGIEEKKVTCINPDCQKPFAVKDSLPQYSLKVGGETYQLRFGRQWIGRKSDGSDAEVQIPDPSNYMSRRHAVVELRCTAAGVEVTFEEHGKNPTRKDGVPLIEDDIIYLAVNDCLEMGGRKMYLDNQFRQD